MKERCGGFTHSRFLCYRNMIRQVLADYPMRTTSGVCSAPPVRLDSSTSSWQDTKKIRNEKGKASCQAWQSFARGVIVAKIRYFAAVHVSRYVLLFPAHERYSLYSSTATAVHRNQHIRPTPWSLVSGRGTLPFVFYYEAQLKKKKSRWASLVSVLGEKAPRGSQVNFCYICEHPNEIQKET